MTYNDNSYFEYTKEFSVDSSVIDTIFYNENNRAVLLDVNDEMYRYDDVDSSDIGRLVVGDHNGSVGAYYNTSFKKNFGPATHLGHWTDVECVRVPVVNNNFAATTAKDLTTDEGSVTINNVTDVNFATGETKEYSLNIDGDVNPASVLTVSDEPTKEFSLSFEDEAPEVDAVEGIEGVREIVVHFTLNGAGDKRFKYEARDALTVEGAIEELNDFVSRMGASGRVRKVVVKFD